MNYKKLLLVYLITFSLPVFAQQADMSLIPYRQGNLWGYASPDKKIVITPVYNDANLFYMGYASVKKGTKYGYINKAGKVVIPFKFFSAGRFRYGYTDNVKTHKSDTVLFAGAALTANDIERCIDTRGKRMAKCPAINENSVLGNNKQLIKDSAISLLTTLRKSETFDMVTEQYQLPGIDADYFVAVKDNKYGILNNKFEMIIPFEYSLIKKLKVDNTIYLVVEKNGLKGLLNGDGSIAINVVNSRLEFVKASNGFNYFIVAKDGNTGIVDNKMTALVNANYYDIQYDIAGGFVLTGTNNLKGAYFLNNKLIEAKYAEVMILNNGNYALVKMQNGRSGYVNNEGIDFFED